MIVSVFINIFLVFCFWFLLCLFCLPLLSFKNFREIFNLLPYKKIFVNYFTIIGLFIGFHISSILIIHILIYGTIGQNTIFYKVISATTIIIVLLGLSIVCILLPYLDIWKPKNNEGIDGRIIVILGGIWYVFWTIVFSFIFIIILALLNITRLY